MAVAGALTIAFSAILVQQAGVSPSTAAIFRCAYALPLLGRAGVAGGPAPRAARRREPRARRAAGVFFAVDLICWHHAIEDVGAGLATVLGNLQVAFVPLVAWAVLGERPAARVLATLPLVLGGVVLISGVLEEGAYGDNPARGVIFGAATGLAYAGFILVLRAGGGELRRARRAAVRRHGGGGRRVRPSAGLIIGDADLVPVLAGPRVARGARAELAGGRLAADLAPRCRACPRR